MAISASTSREKPALGLIDCGDKAHSQGRSGRISFPSPALECQPAGVVYLNDNQRDFIDPARVRIGRRHDGCLYIISNPHLTGSAILNVGKGRDDIAAELALLFQSAAVLMNGRTRRDRLWLCTATAHGRTPEEQHEHIRNIAGRIAKAGDDPVYVVVREHGRDQCDLHAHFVLRYDARDLVPDRAGHMIPERLARISRHATVSRYDTPEGDGFHVKRIHNLPGLTGYLTKELFTGADLVGGGGSRVTVSKAMSAALNDNGVVVPKTRYRARDRMTREVVTSPVRAASQSIEAIATGLMSGVSASDLPAESLAPVAPAATLFPLPEAQTPAKPFCKLPRRRPKVSERHQRQVEIPVPLPSVIDLARQLGDTHDQIAARLGISRPHVTNVLTGRFGASKQVVQAILAATAAPPEVPMAMAA